MKQEEVVAKHYTTEQLLEIAHPVARYLIKERQAGRNHFYFSDFYKALDYIVEWGRPDKAVEFLQRVHEQFRIKKLPHIGNLELLLEHTISS